MGRRIRFLLVMLEEKVLEIETTESQISYHDKIKLSGS